MRKRRRRRVARGRSSSCVRLLKEIQSIPSICGLSQQHFNVQTCTHHHEVATDNKSHNSHRHAYLGEFDIGLLGIDVGVCQLWEAYCWFCVFVKERGKRETTYSKMCMNSKGFWKNKHHFAPLIQTQQHNNTTHTW